MASPQRHHGRIDPDAAIAFALATNDPNEAYQRGEAVPPLYTAALIQPGFASGSEENEPPVAIHGSRGGVHAQQDVRFFGPVRPGDRIQWELHKHSARQTPAGVLVTHRIRVWDDQERPLVEHLWSSMHIGGTVEADVGPPLEDHTFPEAARARPLGGARVPVALDQSFRYGGVSGDRNPHSIDDEAARREGYPGKILQGLCTLAMCSGVVVAKAAGGHPERLRRFAGRFTAPVLLRQELVVELYDAGRADDGARVVAFEATAGGTVVVKHGRAEVQP